MRTSREEQGNRARAGWRAACCGPGFNLIGTRRAATYVAAYVTAHRMRGNSARPDPHVRPGIPSCDGLATSARGLGNDAATTLDLLETLVRSRLQAIQRRPDLINALLGQTGPYPRPRRLTDRPWPFNLCKCRISVGSAARNGC